DGRAEGGEVMGRLNHLLSIAIMAVAVARCGAPAASRFFTLDSAPTPAGSPPARFSVLLRPLSLPASSHPPEVGRARLPNRVDVDEFNRWASPLNDSIARAVAGDLSALLGTPDVAVAPLANFNPDYRVTLNVQRFDSIAGQGSVIDAVWAVHATKSGNTRS